MVLRLTNTLGKTKEDIVPQHPDGVLRCYHCGPTVYATPHLGNLRRFLVADLLVRTARLLQYRVRSVMNITDVGHLLGEGHPEAGRDRLLLAAEREGRSPEQVAARYAAEFFAALVSLRAEPADYFPRATLHIPQMLALIQRLLDKGLAYLTPSGVYFDVTKWPSYGLLSGNTPEALLSGARVEIREDKRHPADFALWIQAPPEHRMQWDAPWGRGYPGWHLECSAMSMHILGETIDIHTGGVDNLFPHHENEIAQSEGATGKPFVRTWLHNEFLEFGDGKMSKSEGAVLTLNDLQERGYDLLAFRLLVLQTHYRSKLHFSWEALEAAQSALTSLRSFGQRLQDTSRAKPEGAGDTNPEIARVLEVLTERFKAALSDDLGSPEALAAVFDGVRSLNSLLQSRAPSAADLEAIRSTFRALDTVLALLDVDASLPSPDVPEEIQQLAQEREDLRRRGEFSDADRLRADLSDRGYRVEDTPQGPRLFKK